KSPLISITEDILQYIRYLGSIGCNLLRFAVPNTRTAEMVGELSTKVSVPVVADIHFNHKIALKCMDYPIAKIRINPGNIGAKWKVRELVSKAKERGIPIRIGVNEGSLPPEVRGVGDLSSAMVKAAEMELEILDQLGFNDIVVSLKSSNIDTTLKANMVFLEKYDYPLHIGITEAGPLINGIVKSTVGLGRMLENGIGDTVRVSLSDSCVNEIIAAREILKAFGKYEERVNLISCPKCGRASFDVHRFLEEIEPYLLNIRKNITVAVMGCVVNGPGEASHADIGITGIGKEATIFKDGKVLRKIPADRATEIFKEELEKI
ncbi:MAG: 4-hydroxy-3-methylbut-2-en-1-yl diphosphate synthase, partial [Spirochaetes bacterium]